MNKQCTCPEHQHPDVRVRAQHADLNFIPDRWQLRYGSLSVPSPEDAAVLEGHCAACLGSMPSESRIPEGFSKRPLIAEFFHRYSVLRPFSTRVGYGQYESLNPDRNLFYSRQDHLSEKDRTEAFIALFRQVDREAVRSALYAIGSETIRRCL